MLDFSLYSTYSKSIRGVRPLIPTIWHVYMKGQSEDMPKGLAEGKKVLKNQLVRSRSDFCELDHTFSPVAAPENLAFCAT